ncbi:6-phosphofructokinase subunit alpha [Nadsonia fulvescens var. elongata DSM 6958]|uniref:ATP-dependent 6-phosphofructokinase n=1 Tax=Nadsonia fulvescens var. elongata DSM 6958 TaxID=857566 RepID=A0A1E3PPM6_9ASCO|nr:6-phosphofructokinase subunit alpha [Nadsonia fulvescens var. elongata DSM 6958]
MVVSSALISGVSFISLATAEKSLFDAAVQFYVEFGFSVAQTNSHVQPDSVSHDAASASNTFEEVMLHTFAADSTSDGITLKIRLTDNGVSADEATHQGDALALAQDTASNDVRGLVPSIVFYTPDLEQARAQLEGGLKAKVVQLSPDDLNPIEIYTADPLGNLIGFTSRANPFSLAAPVSSENSTSTRSTTTASGYASTGTFSKAVSSTSIAGDFAADVESGLNQLKRKRIAVMTSGGDAQGMNASVRAVVRTAIDHGCEAFAVLEGYEGLIRGGEYIKPMSWDDVRGWLSLGGTAIGTARCLGFRERKGRLTAAHNMIKSGIDAIIICGGDGSLTGADLFRSEWPSLLEELVSTGVCAAEDIAGHENLNICGLVGSIDNDMCTTDATIGGYSSLQRICESVDYIDATAQSHSRAFVIEVMGRHCGWLALMAAIATGADYLFIPERAPSPLSWGKEMCDVVERHRNNGKRKSVVIVAEGAIDDQLNAITPDMVKDVLVDKLGLDTRVTTLGHVQRGGPAVAFDRMLATLQGVEAVEAILSQTPDKPSPMIAINENKICRKPLVDSVALTKSVADAIDSRDFDKAMSLRDPEFIENLDSYYAILSADEKVASKPAEKPLNVAIICIGAPAGGMNAAIRSAASYCFARGHKPYAIHNGWTGLARHESIRELNWLEVEEWCSKGGCEIGTNRNLPETDLGMIAYYFQKYKLDGLIIVGGFEAFNSLNQLENARINYPAFRIPMVCLPATVSNNVPGSEYSLGSDTCLNSLVEYCDVIKQSASSTRERVFVVEVQGGNSGYCATYAGLVTGAHAVYTPESGISLRLLESDIDFLKTQFKHDNGRDRAGKLILRNEKSSKTFTTQILADIIKEEAHGNFETRTAIPGHVQQGGIPSPMDRVRATRFAVKCVQFLESSQSIRDKHVSEQSDNYVVIGIRGATVVNTPIRRLYDFETNIGERRPKKAHWTKLGEVADMLVARPKSA